MSLKLTGTKKPTRPDFDTYFMNMAKLAATRSTCVRRGVGAVLTVDNHVVATGYNGPPKDCPHMTDETCVRNVENIPSGERTERVCCAHAEANAIAQAAKLGHPTKGSTLYTTLFPCSYCARFLVNAGVKRVVYVLEYSDEEASEIMLSAGVTLSTSAYAHETEQEI